MWGLQCSCQSQFTHFSYRPVTTPNVVHVTCHLAVHVEQCEIIYVVVSVMVCNDEFIRVQWIDPVTVQITLLTALEMVDALMSDL